MDSPSLSQLESLPLLLLEDICEYLAPTSYLTPSLQALSLASRSCCFATVKRRFKYIHIRLDSPAELQKDADRWTAILSVDGRARKVHHVKISGFWLQDPDHQATRQSAATAVQMYHDIQTARGGEMEEAVDWAVEDRDDPFFQPDMKRFNIFLLTLARGAQRSEADIDWQPLVHLLAILPVLKDLIYSHTKRFPACLLSAFYAGALRCRLHLHTFDLTLLATPSLQQEKHENSHLLLASPHLHSLVVLSFSDQEMFFSLNEKAAIAVVLRTAPNLRNLRSVHTMVSDIAAADDVRPFRNRRPHFDSVKNQIDSYINQGIPQERPGKLESLHLDGYRIHLLPKWLSYLGFSHLKSLRISEYMPLDMIHRLTEVAADGALPNLHSLVFITKGYYPRDSYDGLDEAISSLLLAVPPLSFLEVGGWIKKETLNAIVAHHSPLQHLSFLPTNILPLGDPDMLTAEDIKSLSRLRRLGSLRAVIKRPLCPAQEASVYRALSTLTSLRKAELVLNCKWEAYDWVSLPESTPVEGDSEEGKTKCAHFLSLVALDKALARTVFDAVSNQGGLKHLKLSMNLYIDNQLEFYARDGYCELLRWVAREWLFSKDMDGVVHVRELNEHQRKALKAKEILRLDLPDHSKKPLGREIWDRAWPPETWSANDNRDWTDQWRSWPREEVEEGGEAG